jgi:hypothetical protein
MKNPRIPMPELISIPGSGWYEKSRNINTRIRLVCSKVHTRPTLDFTIVPV